MTRQNTLVAFYGAKPAALEQLIALCWKAVADVVGEQFSPYRMGQIHATVVGLEHTAESAVCNYNFQRHRGRSVEMNLQGYLRYLMRSANMPFSIQIGGFANRDYPFTSRGQRPYDRSFSVQGNKAVVMGWPVDKRTKPLPTLSAEAVLVYPTTLNTIRSSAQDFGILHSYHRVPSEVDNDFYFRIGLLKSPNLTESTRRNLDVKIREILSNEPPVVFDVDASDLYVASYGDDTLPEGSTSVYSVLSVLNAGDDLGVLN